MPGRTPGEEHQAGSTFVTRVRVKNFKSIGSCDAALAPLTFLLGPNGAGKSNFLDALRFVADSLRTSLDHALRDRGGIVEAPGSDAKQARPRDFPPSVGMLERGRQRRRHPS